MCVCVSVCQAGGIDTDRWNKIASARYPSVQDPPYAFQKLCKVSMPNDGERLTLFHLPVQPLFEVYGHKQGWRDYYNLSLNLKCCLAETSLEKRVKIELESDMV